MSDAALTEALGRILPREDQTLLLTASLGEGDEVAAAWTAWRARHPDPVAGLRVFGYGNTSVTPLLHRGLCKAGVPVGDDAFAATLAAGAMREERRAAKVHEGAGGALAALGEAGVEPLVVGGVQLAELAYPAVGLRHTYDLDLLVTEEEQRRAASTLREFGGIAPERPTGRGDLIVEHELGVPVALHTKPFPVRGPTLPMAEVRRRRRRATVSGADVWVPAPEDALVHALGMGPAGWTAASVLWVPDVWFLLRANPELDWALVAETASESRLAIIAAAALAYLRERLGAPVPQEALERLRTAAGRASRAERDFVLLAALRAQRLRDEPVGRSALPATSLAVARRLPSYLGDRLRGRQAVHTR